MELSTLEKLELGLLENICRIFFDQMGFEAKPANRSATEGISGLTVLYSKTSKAPFSLYQCGVRQVKVDQRLLGQLKDSLIKLNLPSGYFITTGSPDPTIAEYAKANRINLIDGTKFVELINNLPEAVRNLLNETISPRRPERQIVETGRHSRQSEIGMPPLCSKCGERMKFQVSTGKYRTGKYWQCPNPDCGHITALV